MFGSVAFKARPIRLAYLVEPNDTTHVREAIRLSSTLWGGAHFPMIPYSKRLPASWREKPFKSPSAESVSTCRFDWEVRPPIRIGGASCARRNRSGMQFIKHDLGYRQAGEIVEVTLSGNAANVRLMDSSNLSSYQSGRQHRYYGGLAKRSPVHLQIPHSGHWYVTVDMQGLGGSVRSAARVLPGPLPEIREVPLSSVPSLLQGDRPPGVDMVPRDYDVFVSHASEDKEDVVRPLAHALSDGGLSVWYDEFELKIGDSLRRKIDTGLARSRFGVVVLSRSFFRKGWTNYELDGLVTRAVSGEQILLPIWHEITKQELVNYSPSLADKVARSTATHTIDEIAKEIIAVIRGI